MRAKDPDVVVVGAGIAGASIAAVLARGGLEVLLLERQRTYRDRVRGEYMAPWGVRKHELSGSRPSYATLGPWTHATASHMTN
jgi:menaquinone-9 beta-reductase